MTLFFVGLASGLASATLSLSLLTGSTLAVLLFIFAPLPILIASIGWNHRAGFLGAVGATALLFSLAGFDTARGYALSIGLPAWWLGYLALLGRPSSDAPDAPIDWYPVGRLVLWASALGAGLVLLSILLAGSFTDYQALLRTTFEAFLRQETGTPADAPITLPGGQDVARLTDFVVRALPPLGAMLWTANAIGNLWLAGRIARASDRLVRPWPDLATVQLPSLALPAFAIAAVGTFAPVIGTAFGVVAATLSVAFSVVGLAFLHYATRGVRGRGMMLAAAYLLLVVQAWPAIFLTALGVVEQLFQLRARIALRRGQQKPPQRR